MSRNCMAWALAIVVAFAFASDAAAKPPSSPKTHHQRPAAHSVHRGHIGRFAYSGARVIYAPGAPGARRGRRGRFVELAGDPFSGFGFYPLPVQYQMGAWRYRVTHMAPPWANPVRFAVAADAARYYYNWIPANRGYRYGVFDPIEGVGSPFFAGYYGPAGDDDDSPEPPFGRPYRN